MSKIKVLIIEDSLFMQKILSEMVNSSPDMEVAAVFTNGQEALNKFENYSPDVITLDMNLPGVNGIDVLSGIMLRRPTPVIMVSAYTRDGAEVTINALSKGAVDFIAKPSGEVSLDMAAVKEEFLSKIKLAATAKVQPNITVRPPPGKSSGALINFAQGFKKLIIIAASTGGPQAILELFSRLPKDIAAAFIVVQHMPQGLFTSSFAQRITIETKFPAMESVGEAKLFSGLVYVAVGGYHTVVEKKAQDVPDSGSLKITKDPYVNFVRPSATTTMISAAEAFGPDVIGVVLTGMGKDGLEGARKIKEKKGFVIAQDRASSVIYGMPRVVVEGGLADRVLPLPLIAEELVSLCA